MTDNRAIEPRRTGALVPLTKDEVALDEAKAHFLGLRSLVSMADGITDEDVPFPYESNRLSELDEVSLDELAYAEYAEQEDPE